MTQALQAQKFAKIKGLKSNMTYYGDDVVRDCFVSSETRYNMQEANLSPSIENFVATFLRKNEIENTRHIISQTMEQSNDPGKFNSSSNMLKALEEGFKNQTGSRLNSEKDGYRLNDQGQYFNNTLQQVLPMLLMQPTRGTPFMVIPMVSLNPGGTSIIVQAYNWYAPWTKVLSGATQNIGTVTVSPYSVTAPIITYRQNITLEYNDNLAMSEAYIKNKKLGGIPYDQYVGFWGAIAVKYLGQAKSYLLQLDSIAWTGAETIEQAQLGDVTYPVIVDGTGDNEVSLVTLADVFPTSTPTSFSDLSLSQMQELLMYIINNVLRNSQGNFVANTLYIDLNTYTKLYEKVNEYKDTTALGFLKENHGIDVIVPIPAWSLAYPDQVTISAQFSDQQVFFFNLAQPMTVTGVQIITAATQTGYQFKTSGLTLVNTLGMSQFVCPINDGVLSLDKKSVGRESRMMKTFKQSFGKLKAKVERDAIIHKSIDEKQKKTTVVAV